MKCSELLLDLVQWALCSSWCRTTPDLMCAERAGSSWMMKAVVISFFVIILNSGSKWLMAGFRWPLLNHFALTQLLISISYVWFKCFIHFCHNTHTHTDTTLLQWWVLILKYKTVKLSIQFTVFSMAFYESSTCSYIYIVISSTCTMRIKDFKPMMTPAAQSFRFQGEKKERKLAHRWP